MTRLLIRKPLLKLIIQEIPKIYDTPQPYLTTMYQALFMTTYFGLFRVREVTKGPHVIKAKDVHIGKNKKKLMFVLHTSKTHGLDAKPQIVKINSCDIDSNAYHRSKINKNPKERFCPFVMLQRYVEIRRRSKCASEQFFIFRDRTPVLPTHFRALLKTILKRLGLNESLYGIHSIRGAEVQIYWP